MFTIAITNIPLFPGGGGAHVTIDFSVIIEMSYLDTVDIGAEKNGCHFANTFLCV